ADGVRSISRILTRRSGKRLPAIAILRDAGSGPVETEKSCLNEPSGMRPPRSMPGERKDGRSVFLSLRRYDPDQVRRVPATWRCLSPHDGAPLGNTMIVGPARFRVK